MKSVFADTLYWLAIVRPNDQWHGQAVAARSNLGNTLILTTDEILAEFLSALSQGGLNVRRQAAVMVREIQKNPNVRVIPQSRDSFMRGLTLYEQRLDKGYSLVDCVSMNVMTEHAVSDILTHDHHFAQEGFTTLI